MFGFDNFFYDKPLNYSTKTLDDTILLAWSYDKFHEILRKYPRDYV